MTIKKMMMTGAAALAVVGVSAPAAGAAEAPAAPPGVLHQVGDALSTGEVGSRMGAGALTGLPAQGALPRSLTDSVLGLSPGLLG
jgi:hypothetical protein